MPEWLNKWENTDLIAWIDKNDDGKINLLAGSAIEGKKPVFIEGERGKHGQRLISNPSKTPNELFVDNDIMVLANPEIARLPNWIIALVAAGGLAAALSTAAGLLLVISTAISHDLIKKQIKRDISDKGELLWARIGALFAVLVAGWFGINPPGFVAATVALAFGLAAASFFPAIVLGIFDKNMNREGAVAGMVVGITLMLYYMLKYKLGVFDETTPPSSEWWFNFGDGGVSPEGFGTFAMLVNFIVSITVSRLSRKPPIEVQQLVEDIRIPKGAGNAHMH